MRPLAWDSPETQLVDGRTATLIVGLEEEAQEATDTVEEAAEAAEAVDLMAEDHQGSPATTARGSANSPTQLR